MLRVKPGSDSLSFPVSHILGFPLLYIVAQVGQTLRFSTFYRGFIQIPTQPLTCLYHNPALSLTNYLLSTIWIKSLVIRIRRREKEKGKDKTDAFLRRKGRTDKTDAFLKAIGIECG